MVELLDDPKAPSVFLHVRMIERLLPHEPIAVVPLP